MKIEHDGVVTLSVGKSRKELHWKNEDVLWSDLLVRLSETHRTAETHAEYIAATKARQDEIKDVGGFVGGVITGGRRKAGSIAERHLLTLDADFSAGGLWDTFTMLYDCAACVYSTHKHTPESNRLRLIIPLSRAVFADEYEAVGRKVAEAVGIEDFDPTTFEPSRLMYWASTSKDGEFVFDYQDGAWLDADGVLAEYKDWRDSAQWAVSSRVSNVIRREIKKADDPTEKDGIIGAFCRAYSIHEAIEVFLSDYYEKCDSGEDRYTYKHGSTAGGLVTYDDKWAYSHHGTDPTGGKLSNAFDLARVHLFGLKDENVNERTNITKYPSYLAMLDFAAADTGTKKQLFDDRMASAKSDFADGPEEVENGDWTTELEYDRKNNLLPTPENARLIMENDPNLKDLAANDIFSKRIALLKLPFWRREDDTDMFFNDTDEAEMRLYLSGNRWGIKGKDLVMDTFKSICARKAFHPIRDYLNGLEWDGTERLDAIFIDALGIEDSDYARATTRVMFVGAVERIMRPGSFMDYVMVFVGEEGIGKSKLLYRLARRPYWFVDSCPVTGKEAYENIRGKWLVEMAELVELKKTDTGVIKNFISKTSDFYRAAYDRYPQDQARQCVFFGSGNDLNFLRGVGGDRRFLPVEVSKKRKVKEWSEYTEDEIDMIWAEARHRYDKGEKPILSKKIERIAYLKQCAHTEIDSWGDVIDDFLAVPVPIDWKTNDQAVNDIIGGCDVEKTRRDSVTIREIWEQAFGERKPIDYQSQARIKKIMDRKKDDWEYKPHKRGGKTVNGFRLIVNKD